MADLEQRLAALGGSLAFPRADTLADDVLAELATPTRRWRRPLLVAAAATVLAVAAIVAVPDTRDAVARWLGFDSLRIEVVDRVPADVESVLDTSPPTGDAQVTVLPGQLDEASFAKIVAAGTTVTPVDVDGLPGYWIEGAPHAFLYADADGVVREARFAANTLVWQDGDELIRVEGDISLREALDIAALPRGS